MDERIEIWSLLHDGEITAVAREGEEALTIVVSIPYLRHRLEPPGDGLVVRLEGGRHVEWSPFSGSRTTLEEDLSTAGPEILGTRSESMPVRVGTTVGVLSLAFDSVALALDTGEPLPYAKLRQVCEEYWTEWQRRTEQAGAAAGAKRPG